MASIFHLDRLSSDQITRVQELWYEKLWHIKEVVKLEVDRIILPWFPEGIKWTSEQGQYGLETARETFWKKILQDAQMQELLSVLWDYDKKIAGTSESVFSHLLWIKSGIHQPYLVEWKKTLKSLITMWEKRAHEFFLGKEGNIRYQAIQDIPWKDRKAFKIRLQAD